MDTRALAFYNLEMNVAALGVSHQRTQLLKAPVRVEPSSLEHGQPTEQYVGSTSQAESLLLPSLEEPRPEDLKRGYLWQAVPLPSPLDGILGALVSFGPIPKLMGLEPAPKARPQPDPLPFSWTGAQGPEFTQQVRAQEALLRDPAAVELGKRRIKGGSNANFLVTLSNGASAVWTPKAGEKSTKSLRKTIPDGTQAQREEAAYLVDKRLGHLARVPPAVSTGLEGRPGSLKLLVSQGQDGNRTRSEEPFSPSDYRRIALFDHVVGNLDRHSGNFLLDREARPIPIDHGLAFPVENGDQGFNNFHFDASFPLDEKERATLSKFSQQRDEVTLELQGLLEPKAISAMFERVDRMLELGWVSHEWRQG